MRADVVCVYLLQNIAFAAKPDAKQVHVLSSGLKAAATWTRVEVLQNCRCDMRSVFRDRCTYSNRQHFTPVRSGYMRQVLLLTSPLCCSFRPGLVLLSRLAAVFPPFVFTGSAVVAWASWQPTRLAP
jgi:hypothetical protein